LKKPKHYIITGNAGSGKTTKALEIGKNKGQVVLIRNTEEVGKPIGYLKGDAEEKTAPYFQMYDSLVRNVFGKNIKLLTEKEIIKFMPVTFLRGITLEGCIIVDEAQNLTFQELYTVLTRIGMYSSLVVVGDSAQCDLRYGPGDFERFCDILLRCDNVEHLHLKDNYRSPLLNQFIEEQKSSAISGFKL
jgi:phosphate starvation-inducible PhoH-like protein